MKILPLHRKSNYSKNWWIWCPESKNIIAIDNIQGENWIRFTALSPNLIWSKGYRFKDKSLSYMNYSNFISKYYSVCPKNFAGKSFTTYVFMEWSIPILFWTFVAKLPEISEQLRTARYIKQKVTQIYPNLLKITEKCQKIPKYSISNVPSYPMSHKVMKGNNIFIATTHYFGSSFFLFPKEMSKSKFLIYQMLHIFCLFIALMDFISCK